LFGNRRQGNNASMSVVTGLLAIVSLPRLFTAPLEVILLMAADLPDAYVADAPGTFDESDDDASLYCYPPNHGQAAIRTAEGAHDACVHTATFSGDAALHDLPHGEGDSAGTEATASGLGAWATGELPADGSVDFDGEDFSWIDQWMEDGGDAAGIWAAPGEAGPLTGGIWSAPIGAEALGAGEITADGVVAVADAIAADEPASMSDLTQTDAAEVVTDDQDWAAVASLHKLKLRDDGAEISTPCTLTTAGPKHLHPCASTWSGGSTVAMQAWIRFAFISVSLAVFGVRRLVLRL
jgi:hypothetical protein